VVLAAIFIVTTNNYLDRIMLNTLSTVLMDDLKFGDREYGYIQAAFNLAYACGFLLMGKVIDQYGTRIGYAISIFFWSLTAAAHALARNFWHLAFWRGALGVAESGNFPAGIKAVTEWFPKRDRAFATSLFNSGTNIASIGGPPLFYYLNMEFGWRACFLATASTGMVCLAIWWWLYRVPRQHPWVNEAELAIIESDPEEVIADQVSWVQALGMRATWGFAMAKFLSDPVWWFYLQWLVPFFKKERHLDLKDIWWTLPVIYFAASIGSVLGGWMSGMFIRRGWTAWQSRRAAMGVFAICMPIAAFAVRAESLWATVALLSLATAGHQGWSANLYTTVSDRFPKNTIASVIGIGGFAGGIGGVVFASLVPGFLIPIAGYLPVFVIMGSLHIIAFGTAQFFYGTKRVTACG
jgi:ACS family hexuronate transporter-like MFS transporter